MGAVVALDTLFNGGQVWKGRPAPPAVSPQPTGHAALDAALPTGGWPEAALTEILLAGQGVGELQLVWPALARLSAAGERIVLVAPPYVPYPPGRGRTPGSICASCRSSRPVNGMPCGRLNNACVPAVAVRCCAGRTRPMTGRYGACRWRRKPARPWRSPTVLSMKRSTLHPPPCASPSTPGLRNCACSSAGAGVARSAPIAFPVGH